ncbi:MAG: tyrosine-type recombinase/integrase, partial [Candidatus Poribacteria bacterium]
MAKRDSGTERTVVRFRSRRFWQGLLTKELRAMLTATKIKNTRPKDRAFKLYDSKGLFLLVNPNGKMYWRYRYQYNNKAKTLSLGPYPLVSLKSARDERDEMFLVLKKGIDPSAERKLAKSLSEAYEDQHTFRYIALQYLLKQAGRPPTQKHRSVEKLQEDFDQCMEGMAANASTKPRSGTLRTMHRRLERFIFPYVGNQNIRSMTGPQFLSLIRKIEERDIAETARRTLAACRRVCRFAVSEGKADFDAAGSIDARESLVPVKRRHFPTITEPRKI